MRKYSLPCKKSVGHFISYSIPKIKCRWIKELYGMTPAEGGILSILKTQL
jgi:hypothetical protein